MAYNSSTSSLSIASSASESSTFSSPCSSPSFLPLPPPPFATQLSVPFLWEEKPGISKPPPSSSSLKPPSIPKNLFYGTSLDLPPLPPPPCLSHRSLSLSLSQPRCTQTKLLAASYSLLPKRSNDAKPSKEEHHQDPFFLALKACTKVDNREEQVTFHGLPAALSIFKPAENGVECKKGDFKKTYGNSYHHHTRRGVSLNHHQTRRGLSFTGEGNGRGKSVATSSHGSLHDLFSKEDKTNTAERRRSNLYTLLLQKDEESTNSMAKKADHHMNAAGKASSRGCVMNVGAENRGKQEDPTQDLHGRASRREHLMGAEMEGHSKPNLNGHRKLKHKDSNPYNERESKNEALGSMKQGHSRAKHSVQVVELNYCGGSKLNMFSDMLGCKPLPPLNGAAIHPSLYIQDKLFSHPC